MYCVATIYTCIMILQFNNDLMAIIMSHKSDHFYDTKRENHLLKSQLRYNCLPLVLRRRVPCRCNLE